MWKRKFVHGQRVEESDTFFFHFNALFLNYYFPQDN
jgi:hypothetical protein